MSNITIQVGLHIPAILLDKRYEVTCSCGVYKDFGYMHITCDRWADQHRARGSQHDVTIRVSDAPPIERVRIDRKLFKKRLCRRNVKVV